MSFHVERARDLTGKLELEADDVIIGSGAGGAVVAALLAEAGRRVIVLEEGPYVPIEEIKQMRPSQHLRRAWRDGGMTVAVGVGDSPSINVTMGRAVGGSSIVTGAVCFRTPESVLDEWVREHGLADFTPEKLAPHFEEVERNISVEEVPVSMRSKSTQRFAEGAAKLGLEMRSTRRNTKGCEGCGRCNFGCPHGAKMSVDMTYLPRAVAAGATVFSDVLVEGLEIENGRVRGVVGRALNRPQSLGARVSRALGRGKDRVHVRAQRVVVAAGAYHTHLLLDRAKVGARSGQVGRNMTLHPAFRMFARFEERLDGWQGALQSAYTKSLEKQGITMVGLFVPPGVLAATMHGFGAEHVRRAQDIPHLAVFGGLIHDLGGGVVRRGPGREPLVTYRMAAEDRQKIPTIVRTMGDIFFAAGAKEVFPPILGQSGLDADAFRKLDLSHIPAMRIECSSQHPLGSARMGVEAGRSVVKPNGEAWDVAGLYVADGSVVPTSLGVNPQLTIMTLATRIARGMIDSARS
ncbi:MAG: GMC family oxidoreductase [Polyangiaceae bacterium]